MADDLPFLVKWKFNTDMKLREIMFMKRRILIAVTLLAVLSLMLPGSEAVADGESADQPILVTENQKFSVNITPDFNACYYTFTPQNNDLYAIEFEGDCDYYINEFTEDWYYVGGKYLQAGQDRYVLGELAKGTTINFLIFSYQDQPNITARISIVAPFSYAVLFDGTASITDVAVRGDIVIPSTIDGYTVTNLAEELFYGEEGITSVQVPATVTYFGSSKTNVDFDYVFSYCYDLESIIVDPANTAYKSVDGVLYTKDGSHLVNYPCAKAGVSYHTNAGVLSCTSFASCSYLKYLYLDNSETQWKGFTFYNTPELTTLYKPGGICETGVLSNSRRAMRVRTVGVPSACGTPI